MGCARELAIEVGDTFHTPAGRAGPGTLGTLERPGYTVTPGKGVHATTLGSDDGGLPSPLWSAPGRERARGTPAAGT
jgi:hypothetical protein